MRERNKTNKIRRFQEKEREGDFLRWLIGTHGIAYTKRKIT